MEPFVPLAVDCKPYAVYEYRIGLLGGAVICDGETSFIERYLQLDDFILPFGGWIALTDDQTGRAYLGVWGGRNAKRFRRILRERGANIVIVRGDQHGRRPLRWQTYPAAYHENRLSRKLGRAAQRP